MTQTAQTREALVGLMAEALYVVAPVQGRDWDSLPYETRLTYKRDCIKVLLALEAAGVRLVPVEGRELEFARMSDGTIKVGYNPRTEEGGWALVGDVTKAVTAIEAQRDEALRALGAAKHRLENVRTVLIDGDERTSVSIFTPYAKEPTNDERD